MLNTRTNLASVYLAQNGNYRTQAEPLTHQRFKRCSVEALGEDHPITLNTMAYPRVTLFSATQAGMGRPSRLCISASRRSVESWARNLLQRSVQ